MRRDVWVERFSYEKKKKKHAGLRVLDYEWMGSHFYTRVEGTT